MNTFFAFLGTEALALKLDSPGPGAYICVDGVVGYLNSPTFSAIFCTHREV